MGGGGRVVRGWRRRLTSQRCLEGMVKILANVPVHCLTVTLLVVTALRRTVITQTSIRSPTFAKKGMRIKDNVNAGIAWVCETHALNGKMLEYIQTLCVPPP